MSQAGGPPSTNPAPNALRHKKQQINIIYDQNILVQWRIQDFPKGVAPNPKSAIIFQIFAENCMKMKEFGPLGDASLAPPPLD